MGMKELGMNDRQPAGQEATVSATPAQEWTAGQGDPVDQQNLRTGADQPWDPKDLAVAKGQDPTSDNVERSREELAELGPAAVEKTVP